MAIVLGTSSGFVSVAPTTDPNAAGAPVIGGSSVVTKDTSPAGAVRVTEVGWYRSTGTDTANWEIGLYSDNAGVADVRLQVEATNSSSTTGWLTRSVNWPISPSTAYWLAVQMDAHVGGSNIDRDTTGGAGFDILTGQTALNNPYGGGAVAQPTGLAAIYAVYTTTSIAGISSRATTIIGGAF